MKIRNLFFLGAMSCSSAMQAQDGATFEMRYFTHDEKANGVTDFHGETEWFTTEQRVEQLDHYADYASRWWGDPKLEKPLFTDADVYDRLVQIKPQPLSVVRHTVPLRGWHAIGYKDGKAEAQTQRWALWTTDGAKISEGRLLLDHATASPAISPLVWRFRLKATLNEAPEAFQVCLTGKGGAVLKIPVEQQGLIEVYGDLPNRRVFLSAQGKTVHEYSLPEDFGETVTAFSLEAKEGRASLATFSLYDFTTQPDNKHTPYRMEMIYDEDFQAVPSMEGWQRADYDDNGWEMVTLPSAHGSLRGKGESYYLRTKVRVEEFTSAWLEIETLDPAGEVWVNGQPAAVLRGRLPRKIDVAEYLVPGQVNTIAVRVKPYYAHNSMLHTPSDHNIGWSLGRTSLILSREVCPIIQGFVHTRSLSPTQAVQHHRVVVQNHTPDAQKRILEVQYYPWFPQSGDRVASYSREVELLPQIDNNIDFDITLDNPMVWSTDNPQLYRVRFVLRDADENATDDWVTTTGVRLIEQRQGVLYVNNRPEMLNGGQNFGYRLPLETVATTVRCGTDEMVLRDLMMAQRLGNVLRIHVQSEGYVLDGINDPRYAEYADQLGLYLMWQTAGWIREGETSVIDVKNYPLYIKEVFNHPSIVLWEASNHPNRFKKHDASETTRYFSEIIPAIVQTDSSRLVSPTSFWQHSHYGNYDGSKDYQGNTLPPNPWLMHPMMTRGSQDAYSGYGATWSNIRNMPTPWARECLQAKDLCYFNFEHEESVAQPNWNLSRKEPWFEMMSYEWDYYEGNVGRLLQANEWRASQAYQAFSAWESMKMQILMGVSGFSWCSIESGANMFTYQKPIVDPFYVPKLAFHANRMVFQRLWAGSDDVDTVYGPGDSIRPVIFNLDEACTVTLTIELQNLRGKTLEKKTFRDIQVPAGRSVTRLDAFRFRHASEGTHFLVYKLSKQ